ncbi:MAG TPA: ThiF family adenylyltransferase [Steroidobacteraceae bacterium]|nr:ThiF family adenylyltransferase [Steroidobacteraceae bacterium]
MDPDYSRQIALKSVGAAGQTRLERSRVLVVGAGGLGSPVLQYLAGAGVGWLTVIDHDTLEPSNLHRQPLYALADAGESKAQLAVAALGKLNPRVRVESRTERFGPANALALVADHDLVIDCSDNFRTKFLVSDAAVLARRPAVFASVYQYEGQIQVYKPDDGHACLRCLWPDATADGLVANCAEGGVLGPVPGALGAMQAVLALEILLGIGEQLRGELLLVDFREFSTMKLRAPRNGACCAPDCRLVRDIAAEDPDIEVALRTLDEAAARGWEIVDVRSAEEVAARPAAGTHLPVAELLAGDASLSRQGAYLLVCATGKRSLAAAHALHRRGFTVRSLAGGLARLDRNR